MTLGGVPVAGSAGGCAMFRTQVLTVACTLSPMASWTVGAVTVIAAVPLCPSLVAVIVADPAPVPLTSPLPLTVATAVLLLPHVTTRPGREQQYRPADAPRPPPARPHARPRARQPPATSRHHPGDHLPLV